MHYCQFCGEDAGYMPFKCNYCGGNFCGSHRLPESHQCSFDENYKQIRAKEKERIKSLRIKKRDLGVRGMRSTIGTSCLYFIIISLSILGAFYPNYLNITFSTFYSYPIPLIWTLFTSIFVVTITNIAELCYFIMLMFFSYYFTRAFENRFGPKMLFITYLGGAGIMVVLNLFFSSMLYFYIVLILLVKIGLAPGGLISLLIVLLLENSKRDWYLKNLKLKAKVVLGILIVSSVVSKVITTTIAFESFPSEVVSYYFSEIFVYYIIDFIGPLTTLVIAGIYFQSKKPKKNYY